MDVVKGDGTGAIKLAYYQGYCFKREFLYQDASQIDTDKYTHLHFGFGVLDENYDVTVGDELSAYQFDEFRRLPNVKRILSFGGWDFSTFPETYQIFRNGGETREPAEHGHKDRQLHYGQRPRWRRH
jgi:hypothetical protein